MSNSGGRTKRNAAVGAVVSGFLYIIPGVNLIGPIFGGAIAGYLQHRGTGGGIRVGAVKGLFVSVPAFVIAIVATSVIADTYGLGGYSPIGLVLVITVVAVFHSVLLGVVGGFVGGWISGTPSEYENTSTNSKRSSSTSTTKTSSNPASYNNTSKTPKSSHTGPSKSTGQKSNISSQTTSTDIFCPECGEGTQHSEGQNCAKCGTELKTVCTGCGNHLPPEAQYCRKCGTDQSKSLDGDKTAQPDENQLEAETQEHKSVTPTKDELKQRKTYSYDKKEKETAGVTKLVCEGCGAEVEESEDFCHSCYASLN